MCGFAFLCSCAPEVSLSVEIEELLRRRGPDRICTIDKRSTPSKDHTARRIIKPLHLSFVGSVLSLRGSQVVQQPIVDAESDALFCWNGEAWVDDRVSIDGNDSRYVFDQIVNERKVAVSGRSLELNDSEKLLDAIQRTLKRLQGPFSFLLYDAQLGELFVGRDFLGRRSVLFNASRPQDFIVSSVSTGARVGNWVELEPNWIYRFSLKETYSTDPEMMPENGNPESCLKYNFVPVIRIKENLPSLNRVKLDCDVTLFYHSIVRKLETLLRISLTRRLGSISFRQQSEADVAIMFSGGVDCAVLARLAHELVSEEQPIDLINVAFANPRFSKISETSVHGEEKSTNESLFEECPDRKTARASYAELLVVCPGRCWRLVEVDIGFTDVCEHRDRILSLMHPHATEMDFSIALAFYFAARGEGRSTSDGTSPVKCAARVFLSGLGADELLGGYKRHETAFRRHGRLGLLKELELDMNRLPRRNLGRDDRVISHWGREVRYPYLDEDLVEWALALPVELKCGFGGQFSSIPEAQPLHPEKLILRLLAQSLGLVSASSAKKRAVQFGSRTAKITTNGSRRKGSDIVTGINEQLSQPTA